MLHVWIRQMMLRELGALRREIEAYADEADLWKTPPGIGNSAGTLTLHLTGNLQHFIGGVLSETGYVRDRPGEFARRDVPREDLVREIDRAAEAVATLAELSDERTQQPFPPVLGGTGVTTGDFLLHLASHLAYHVGQVDYHRRIVTGDRTTVDALSIPELATATDG